jgi:hypothetical protein
MNAPHPQTFVASADALQTPQIRRYVIFCRHLFTARDWERFGCEDMIDRGYGVVIVQCGKALEGMDLSALGQGNFKSWAGALMPQTKEELSGILDRLSPFDMIVALPAISPESSWLYLEFARRGLNHIRMSLSALPIGENLGIEFGKGIRQGLWATWREFRNLAHRFKNRLRLIAQVGPRFFILPSPLLWVRAGTWVQPYADHSFKLRRNAVVQVEGFEIFWAKAAERETIPEIPEPFAVFVDSALCHHPDFEIETINKAFVLDKNAYHASLRAFFNKFEQQFGMNVVISLHPKANYQRHELAGLFGDRPTYSGFTAALIRRAALTIAHQSTATVVSAFHRKPCIFLVNDAIERTVIYSDIEARAKWLDQPLINLDRFMENVDVPLTIPVVSEKLYRKFVETFAIAPGAHPSPFWGAVADRFEQLTGPLHQTHSPATHP